MSFKPARLDRVARSLTGAFFCAVALFAFLALTGRSSLLGLAAGMAGIGLASALIAPRAYVFDDGGLTVERGFGVLRVDGPLRVEEVEAQTLSGGKLLGTGGLFGYLGAFRPGQGVRFASALTTKDGALLVRGRTGGVLISPEDHDVFLSIVRKPDE